MPRYDVTMRFVCEDRALVEAANKEEAVERASAAVMGSTLPGEDWVVAVIRSGEVLEHYRPIVRRVREE